MGNLSQFKAAAESAKPAQSFSLLPVGDYRAIISDSEMKVTNRGDGSYLSLTLQVVEGEHSDRLLWANLNLDNPNQKAVDIAEKELASIYKACGIAADDSSELHDIPIMIKVGIQPAKNGYEASNRIKGYEKIGATPVEPPAAQAAPTNQPWKK